MKLLMRVKLLWERATYLNDPPKNLTFYFEIGKPLIKQFFVAD